jgi:hypothetical protein
VLFTTHLLAGALIGHSVRVVPTAFAAGVASHVAMDVLPHWGRWDDDEMLRVARVDGLTALAVAGLALRGAPVGRRARVAAGIAGAGLLDLDKPARHFFGRSPFPRAVDETHARIQSGERRHRWWVDAAATVGLAVLLARLGSAPDRSLIAP